MKYNSSCISILFLTFQKRNIFINCTTGHSITKEVEDEGLVDNLEKSEKKFRKIAITITIAIVIILVAIFGATVLSNTGDSFEDLPEDEQQWYIDNYGN